MYYLSNDILSPEQLLIQFTIQQRNIQWLCHFTPRQNLENIKQFGLMPRNLLQSVHITDPSRYDRHSDAICLSISKPNSWMFNMKQQQGHDLCLILINPIVLYDKNCLFFPHNAATASYRSVSDEQLQGAKAFEALFSEEVTFQKSGRNPTTIWRNDELLESCETTSDQAEVQCLDIIEPKYFLHIFEENIPLEYREIQTFMNYKERNNIHKPILEPKINNADNSKNLIQQSSHIKPAGGLIILGLLSGLLFF